MLRIKNNGGLGIHTEITDDSGANIEGVQSLDLHISAINRVTADVSIAVDTVDVLAHPLLTLETLRQAADKHGYSLTSKQALAELYGALSAAEMYMAHKSSDHSEPYPLPRVRAALNTYRKITEKGASGD